MDLLFFDITRNCKPYFHKDSPVPHVMDNVHAIMSSAAARFSQTQFDHLTGLINARWAKSNDRIREQLLVSKKFVWSSFFISCLFLICRYLSVK